MPSSLSILRTLTRCFQMEVPQQIEEKIRGIDNLERLEPLADLAFDCESVEEFGKTLK